MEKFKKYTSFYISSFLACLFMVVASGCASGGYKLTRQYARWVNSKSLILRILLYIFTGFVFAITLLVDVVVFNTMDFWEGKVSAGTYEFEQDNKTFIVNHSYQEDGKLKMSKIDILDSEKNILQKVVLKETEKNEMLMYVDGKLRSKVENIHDLPLATIYDVKGTMVSKEIIFDNYSIAAK